MSHARIPDGQGDKMLESGFCHMTREVKWRSDEKIHNSRLLWLQSFAERKNESH